MPVLEQKPQSLSIPMPFTMPSISDELLNKLTARIRPVVLQDDQLFYIEPVDPRMIAFTWSPTLAGEANDLEAVATITTLHTFAASVFFKPTIAEVLAQIPVGYVDQIVAFQTDIDTANISMWSEAAREALYWGFHLANTTLYKLA